MNSFINREAELRSLEEDYARAWPEKQRAITLMLFSVAGFTAAVRRWAAQSGAALVDADDLCSHGGWLRHEGSPRFR